MEEKNEKKSVWGIILKVIIVVATALRPAYKGQGEPHMRRITLFIIHCSATRCGQPYSFEDCRRDHIDGRHFRDIGYHYYITRDGRIHPGRPLSLEGAHCFGHNRHSIGICYEGGLDGKGLPADTRTPAQKAALTQLLQELGRHFPAALTVGHRDLNPQKACPSFDAAKEYKKDAPRGRP